MRMNNFTRYTPESPEFGPLALYLQDDKGRDWYASQDKFKKVYTLAINPRTGVIHCITQDVSALFPDGLTVVDIDELPPGCDISGDWVYSNGTVKKAEGANIRQTAELKNKLMNQATSRIQVLADAVDLGMATQKETAQLAQWREYRVLVSRIDTEASDITWPEIP
ncbi:MULTISPECIES: tail fiber assembly protein [Serratia]|uniref:tail fiber assembly protein n=1 Tax=Serratia TaxID=613 RepID=UPI000CF6F242|nr:MULTISPECIES: tail fiber assembly protein [Serratia]AVJ18324.1 tail assembly chaperone [Serratia sp. MYb239]MEB6337880.1 tail fiber assembly protein [Serratia rhizosphaerae]